MSQRISSANLIHALNMHQLTYTPAMLVVKPTYGLTRRTVKVYAEAVEMGYNHDLAMQRLKALYEHNRKFYLSQQQSITSTIN